MPLFFYRSGAFYQPGEIVQAGNWGRVIQAHGNRHNLFFRELVYESIRTKEFADRPSRMSCVFAFEAEAVARNFNNPAAPLLYRVEVHDQGAPTFRADMSWIDVLSRGPNAFDEAQRVARRYWRGEAHANQWEILTMSGLKVEALLG